MVQNELAWNRREGCLVAVDTEEGRKAMTDHAQTMSELADKIERATHGPDIENLIVSNRALIVAALRSPIIGTPDDARENIAHEVESILDDWERSGLNRVNETIANRIAAPPSDRKFANGLSVQEYWRIRSDMTADLPPSDSPGSVRPSSVGALAKYLYENCGLNPPQHEQVAAEILSDYDVRLLSSISDSAHQPQGGESRGPFAWVVLSDKTGHTRMWTRNGDIAKAFAAKHLLECVELHRTPPAPVRAAAEPGDNK